MNDEDLKVLVEAMDFDFHPFTEEGFAAWVARQRGRPIQLVPWPDLPPGVFGVCLSGDEAESVYYRPDLPPLLKRVTLLHELAHIFLGHLTETIPAAAATEVERLTEHLSRALQRGSFYQTAEDEQAEKLALLILARLAGEQAADDAPRSAGADFLSALDVQ